jgi:uroporphyrinogen decarboxylase
MPIETLTPRQRVIRTLNRLPVDRCPIDLGSHMSTGISAFAYWNLLEKLGLPTGHIWLPDTTQMLAMVDEPVRQRFHIDCILLEPPWPATHVWNPRGKYHFHIPTGMQPKLNQDGEWRVWQGEKSMRMPAGGTFFDGDWLSDWSDEDEDAAMAGYAREAERIYKETEYATNYVGYSRAEGFGAFFGDFERQVIMLQDPQRVMDENQVLLEQYLRRAGKIIERMGAHIQLLTIGDDMGTQNGPMCRPALIEKCTAPYIKQFCDFIHRNSDIKVFIHCCGSIKALIPMLIDSGVDVLNPVQISAKNMDPVELKREFGEKIIFWGGGADTQHVLGQATPAEVAEHVRGLVRVFKPGGGFVFNQVHNILGNVPPENIIAMLDTAYEESFYPDYTATQQQGKFE